MERFQAKKFPIFVASKFYYYQSDPARFTTTFVQCHKSQTTITFSNAISRKTNFRRQMGVEPVTFFSAVGLNLHISSFSSINSVLVLQLIKG